MKSLAGGQSCGPLSGKESDTCVAGQGMLSATRSLEHKRKGLWECLGDQPPVVLVTLPAGLRPEEANDALVVVWGSDLKAPLRRSWHLGESHLVRSWVDLHFHIPGSK